MVTASINWDEREFRSALRLYERATKKDETEIVNRTAKNVVLRTMQFTPKQTSSKIRAELRGMESRAFFRLVNARRKRAGLPSVAGAAMAEAAKKFVGKRARSAAYIRAGWIPAAKQLGAAANGRVSSKGRAAKGRAKKANLYSQVAEIVNTATGAAAVGTPALQQAMTFVANDMRAYAEKKMAQTARQFSTA